MAATGDEAVKLSQLKTWGDEKLSGGGFSPATSKVAITNNSIQPKTIRYMGDGRDSTIMDKSILQLTVPIMSMITVLKAAISVDKGGLVLTAKTVQGTEQRVILVTDTTCVIRITG